ncbi:MAG: hypothetical protein KGJ90_05020 [Patescibacteria group bacterium]|nr:hypothetical protein [Patescibacteria group bacterium]
MPSSSQDQHNFMAAIANNPDFAKQAGVPQDVGKDFVAADKAKGKYQPVPKGYSSVPKSKKKRR